MNRTRFYEIIKAHKNGEDLSKFIPKNPPEAALIANLQIGSGSGVNEFMDVYDNPDLSNLWRGMYVGDKYFVVDFDKYADALAASGFDLQATVGSGSAASGSGSGASGSAISGALVGLYQISSQKTGFVNQICLRVYGNTVYLRNSSSGREVQLAIYNDGDTFETILRSLGTQRVAVCDFTGNCLCDYAWVVVVGIYGVENYNNETSPTNAMLSTNPIDYMWFEKKHD